MGAGGSTFVGGSLLAACLLVSGAAQAIEPAQTRASTKSLPALSLPAFLDDERVPDLQEAWQAQVHVPQEASRAEADNVPKAPAAKDPMSAPRAAMQRADEESGEAANVRQRAEELSRRFGAAGPASEPVGSIERPSPAAPSATGAAPEPPTRGRNVVVAPLDTGAGDKANAKAAALGAPVPATTKKVDMGQKLRLAAPPPARKVPPNPVRAPRGTASISEPPSKVGGPPTRSAPARKTPPKVDVTGDVLPTQLRSFGWNAQPE
jgi:hypothetical protein